MCRPRSSTDTWSGSRPGNPGSTTGEDNTWPPALRPPPRDRVGGQDRERIRRHDCQTEAKRPPLCIEMTAGVRGGAIRPGKDAGGSASGKSMPAGTATTSQAQKWSPSPRTGKHARYLTRGTTMNGTVDERIRFSDKPSNRTITKKPDPSGELCSDKTIV